MILVDDMLAVAFQYRDTELWKELTDSDVFAFRLSDGETGYCCVMGNAGEHLALGFYRGRKGFTTYLKTISLGNAHLSEIEMFEMTTTFDCINCDFMQASDMDVKTKKIIRNYADAHKLKIRRSKGWPDFTRHQPGKMQYGITCMEDARDIVEALRAAIAVAAKVTTSDFVKLGFDVNGNYPTAKGGKSVPYLIPNSDGTYEWNTTQLPAFLPDECVAPKFANDILAGEMKKLPVSGTLQMKYLHMPTPIDADEDEAPYLPTVLLCLDTANELVFPILTQNALNNNPEELLLKLVNVLREQGNKPHAIEVEDNKTEFLLKDFYSRCGIRLSRKKELPEIGDACFFLFSNFMM